jgi:hypothetical protein
MKKNFKTTLFIALGLFILSSCARDPKFDRASVTNEEAEQVLFEGRTFEVILTSTSPENVSKPQPLYCDCKTEQRENQKCVKWSRDGEGGSICDQYGGDGTFYTVMNCATVCGQVNVFPSIATLTDRTGAIALVSKGLLIPDNVKLEDQYRDTELPDGSIVRTVLVQVTKKKQLDKNSPGEGETWLVLLERA